MRKWVMMALVALTATNVALADSSCEAKAAAKKLYGAAKGSFIKKCEKDARKPQPICEDKAKEKKLYGAAKNSFVQKCVKDAAAAK